VGEFLAGGLHQAAQTAPEVRLASAALAVAFAHDNEERAWGLTMLGGALRRLERRDEALRVLDAALSVSPTAELERAAYTCTVAVHCDAGDLARARKVGEDARARTIDAKLLAALGRTYYRLGVEKEEPALLAEAKRCFAAARREHRPGRG
jgi:tetratricopeptide (TPR) repeat protein